MSYTALKTVTLAALLCGGTLYADAFNTGKKEGASHRSTNVERTKNIGQTKRVERTEQRVTSKQQKVSEPRYRVTKEPLVKQPKPPAPQKVKRDRTPHYWVPRNVKPLPYYHRPGYTIRTLPTVATTVTLGGLVFFYADGIYYSRYNTGFMVVLPPIGLLVPILPLGYTVFQLRGVTYYYYADVYYIWDVHHSAYRVVEVPEDDETYQPGDVVDILPDGAYTVTIDGVQYYRFNGVYFLQSVQGARVVYVVVTP